MMEKIKNKSIVFSILFIYMIYFIFGVNKVYAEDNKYTLHLDYTILGTLWYQLNVGDTICLNKPEENDSFYYRYYRLYMKEKDSSGKYEILDIDTNNLKIKSSNEESAIATIENGRVLLKGIAEGFSDITLTYTYDGQEITNTFTWWIEPENTPYFLVNGRKDFVLVDNSIVNLKKNEETKKVKAHVTPFTTDFVIYPDGYDKSTYYSYDWKSSDESIVKIQGENNKDEVILKSVAPGEAEIYCTITSLEKQSIIKTVKVAVEDSGNEDSEEYSLDFVIMSGPNLSMLEIGKENVAKSFLKFVKKQPYESIEIDSKDLKITSSNENVATIIEKNNEKIIDSIAEGNTKITFSYTYKEKEYTVSKIYTVFNSDDKFSTGEYAILIDSIVNLEKSKKNNISVSVIPNGTYNVTYPEGYNKSNYYTYEWSSSNESIVKIENGKHNSTATITAVSPGNTEVYCTIKTADGKETIKKTAKINVTGDSEEKEQDKEQEKKEEQEENEEKSKESDDKKDNTVSTNILANTGEKVILPISIVLLIIMSIVFFKKSKM